MAQGMRVYAFGDVHGRADLVDRLRTAIAADLARSAPTETIVIGLGDYIDRGPDSRRVLDWLIAGFGAAKPVFLRGNHEQLLLSFLEDPARHGPSWLEFGGDATLRSYGVDARLYCSAVHDYRAIRDELASRLPVAHLVFLQRLALSHDAGDYFFAHAGVRHGVPLASQKAEDLLWIRQGFVDREVSFEKVIVHGHTPVKEPFLGRFRINADTGAYFTNQLSCVVLEEDTQRLLLV
jgi:serine/threonine protein phosphatase 1